MVSLYYRSLHVYCPDYISFLNRIHVVAGALQSSADDADGYRLKQEATDTYVKNMNYAGRECAKVSVNNIMKRGRKPQELIKDGWYVCTQ